MFVGNNEAVLSCENTDVVDGTALYSGEILLHRQIACWLNLSGGFRMLELDDKLTTSGQDVAGGLGQNLDNNIFTSTRVFNHLYGLQIGATPVFTALGRCRRAWTFRTASSNSSCGMPFSR